MRGRFITLEGGEGAGKSTQAQRLCATLAARGLDVVCTREPGGSPGAEAIRALLVDGETTRWDAMTEALLHYAARRDHLVTVIEPALARGAWVVCDRFSDSTLAYQGIALGLGRAAIETLDRLVVDGCRPDLTLILDVPVEIGLARAHARGGADRYERMGKPFHTRLREAFLDIARREPARCAVIDARADPDAVTAAIVATVDTRLGPIGAANPGAESPADDAAGRG